MEHTTKLVCIVRCANKTAKNKHLIGKNENAHRESNPWGKLVLLVGRPGEVFWKMIRTGGLLSPSFLIWLRSVQQWQKTNMWRETMEKRTKATGDDVLITCKHANYTEHEISNTPHYISHDLRHSPHHSDNWRTFISWRECGRNAQLTIWLGRTVLVKSQLMVLLPCCAPPEVHITRSSSFCGHPQNTEAKADAILSLSFLTSHSLYIFLFHSRQFISSRPFVEVARTIPPEKRRPLQNFGMEIIGAVHSQPAIFLTSVSCLPPNLLLPSDAWHTFYLFICFLVIES